MSDNMPHAMTGTNNDLQSHSMPDLQSAVMPDLQSTVMPDLQPAVMPDLQSETKFPKWKACDLFQTVAQGFHDFALDTDTINPGKLIDGEDLTVAWVKLLQYKYAKKQFPEDWSENKKIMYLAKAELQVYITSYSTFHWKYFTNTMKTSEWSGEFQIHFAILSERPQVGFKSGQKDLLLLGGKEKTMECPQSRD